jgi:hypothetical protein
MSFDLLPDRAKAICDFAILDDKMQLRKIPQKNGNSK